MGELKESQVMHRVITGIFTGEERVQTGFPIHNFYLVLDNGLVLQLLPYGLRLLGEVPSQAIPYRGEGARRCLNKEITGVITDSRFYPPASEDARLQNPPYDDVYILLDHNFWIANRFYENGENSLTVEDADELYNLSEHYFDYWTGNEINLGEVITGRTIE